MTKRIDYYFDLASPASYLAFTQLPAVAKRHGADIVWKPIFVWGLFQKLGNVSPIQIPSKMAWFGRDMARWASRYGVPMAANPHFPFSTVHAMRLAVALGDDPRLPAYIKAGFNKVWVEAKDLSHQDIILEAAKEAAITADEAMCHIQDKAMKQALIDAGDAAADRGVFGVPTVFVGKRMHFGQDRLDFIDEDLAREDPARMT